MTIKNCPRYIKNKIHIVHILETSTLLRDRRDQEAKRDFMNHNAIAVFLILGKVKYQ